MLVCYRKQFTTAIVIGRVYSNLIAQKVSLHQAQILSTNSHRVSLGNAGNELASYFISRNYRNCDAGRASPSSRSKEQGSINSPPAPTPPATGVPFSLSLLRENVHSALLASGFQFDSPRGKGSYGNGIFPAVRGRCIKGAGARTSR